MDRGLAAKLQRFSRKYSGYLVTRSCYASQKFEDPNEAIVFINPWYKATVLSREDGWLQPIEATIAI